MTIQLDHFIVPSRNQVASAQRLAELLGVQWAARSIGPFSAVYLNDGCTLDFEDTDEDFPIYHFCFRVSDAEFDAILARIQASGIAYGSSFASTSDAKVSTIMGGRSVYWTEPENHMWEMLTVSYARAGVKP